MLQETNELKGDIEAQNWGKNPMSSESEGFGNYLAFRVRLGL